MNATSNPFSPAAVVRGVLGWGVKYVACGMLTTVLLLCFGALLFAQVAVWGSQVGWMKYLIEFLPQGKQAGGVATLHANDIGSLLRRGFMLLSLALTVLAALWRGLRRWRSGYRGGPVVALAGSPSLTRHVRLHGGRRMLIGLGVVSVIFACAFAAIPHARMAAGSSHAGLVAVFAALYVIALVFTGLYIGTGIAADWILDG